MRKENNCSGYSVYGLLRKLPNFVKRGVVGLTALASSYFCSGCATGRSYNQADMVADMPKAEIVMPEKDARSTRITTTTNIEEKVSLEMKKVEIPYIAKATLSGKDMAKWIIKT